jgi:hypothetical protein
MNESWWAKKNLVPYLRIKTIIIWKMYTSGIDALNKNKWKNQRISFIGLDLETCLAITPPFLFGPRFYEIVISNCIFTWFVYVMADMTKIVIQNSPKL